MSFLGFIGKTLLGAAGGLITGGPAGAVVGAVGSAIGFKPQAGSGGGGVMPASPLQTAPRAYLGGGVKFPALGPMGGTGTTSLPASAAGTPSCLCSHRNTMIPFAQPGMTPQPLNTACLKGWHLNKSSYYVCTSSDGQGVKVPKGSVCVKTRRMNVGNARALRRALRRAYGFEKLAMRTIKLIHPRKRGSFGGFKRARKR